jgi:hypothetical protein
MLASTLGRKCLEAGPGISVASVQPRVMTERKRLGSYPFATVLAR